MSMLHRGCSARLASLLLKATLDISAAKLIRLSEKDECFCLMFVNRSPLCSKYCRSFNIIYL